METDTSRSRLICLGLLLIAFCIAMPLHVAAQTPFPQQSSSLLASSDREVRLLANLAILMTCTLITIGGLLVFYFRGSAAQEFWGAISVQTLGTIFFFPTLILLAVYLELPKEAITTILGAFLGYLFGRSGSSTPSPSPPTDLQNTAESGPSRGPAPAAASAVASTHPVSASDQNHRPSTPASP